MNVKNTARLVMYRLNKKGLEIFLVNNGQNWTLPEGSVFQKDLQKLINLKGDDSCIELEPMQAENGNHEHTVALECECHEIPSIRAMVKEDLKIIKNQVKVQLKNHLPELEEEGAFVAIKEAFKRVMPHEYAVLKELKDVIVEKNQSKYI